MSSLPPRTGPRRRGLGRGLEALLGPAVAATGAVDVETAAGPAAAAVLLEVDPTLIDANPEQPRHEFDDAALAGLADSIRLHGLLHPIVVERDGARFRLVAGERRLRAARIAGLTTISAIVRPASESARHALEAALTENLARADLSPIEEAMAYSRLADTFGLSHEAIAMRLGRSRPAVTNTIRLLTLPAPAQRAIVEGRMTAGHGKAILGLHDEAAQEAMALRVEREGWSVRRTEEAVQAATGRPAPVQPAAARLSPDDEALRRALEARLGLPVELVRRGRGGRLVVAFHDDEDLDALYTRIGGGPL